MRETLKTRDGHDRNGSDAASTNHASQFGIVDPACEHTHVCKKQTHAGMEMSTGATTNKTVTAETLQLPGMDACERARAHTHTHTHSDTHPPHVVESTALTTTPSPTQLRGRTSVA